MKYNSNNLMLHDWPKSGYHPDGVVLRFVHCQWLEGGWRPITSVNMMASEGRGLPGAKGRRVLMPPFSPQVAPQADERSGLRARARGESLKTLMWVYWACAGAV